jgi:Tfp pilus assembly protein PilN
VRPVNLLPARYRPRTGGSGDSKTAYMALGVLGLLVVFVFVYVMAANKVSSREAEIAHTRQEITSAETQAVTLQGFGDFAGIREQRLQAVRSLATARLDWERLFRELGHVLPAGVWLTDFNGQAAAGDTADTPATLVLQGCAADHRQIADVLVRLRELHVAGDVELTKSLGTEEGEDGGSGGSDSGENCGRHYSFEITINLELPVPGADTEGLDRVPVKLGGGA